MNLYKKIVVILLMGLILPSQFVFSTDDKDSEKKEIHNSKGDTKKATSKRPETKTDAEEDPHTQMRNFMHELNNCFSTPEEIGHSSKKDQDKSEKSHD